MKDRFGKELKVGDIISYTRSKTGLLSGIVKRVRKDGKIDITTNSGNIAEARIAKDTIHHPRIQGVYSLEIHSEKALNLLLYLANNHPIDAETDTDPDPAEWFSLANDLLLRRYATEKD